MRRYIYFAVFILQCVCFAMPSYGQEKITENIVKMEIPNEEDDIKKGLPLYEFKNDSTAAFIKKFADTIIGDDNLVLIEKTDFAKNDYMPKGLKMPEDCIFIKAVGAYYLKNSNKKYMNECKGAIILSTYQVGLIFSDSEDWINELHLNKTEKTLILCSGKSYRPENWTFMLYDDYDPWAVLKVLPDGKVDPLMIYYMYYPVQQSERHWNRYNWMAGFYKDEDWHPGYYDQPNLDPDYIRAKEQQKPKVFPPDGIEL